jgi:excisionase family DNA binding protein
MAGTTVSNQLSQSVAEGFATVADACQYLRVSRATLYKLMDAGDLVYAKMRRSRRIPWRVLKEYGARSLVVK